jgi:diguanylate cyclase (GGDEF)-like protein/PAS domain S-box-containing protein
MDLMSEEFIAEHEALLQFLYLAPVGLVQTSLSGDVELINPLSAHLLMPISMNGGLSNLFVILESVAPELRHLSASFGPTSGTICEGFRIQLSAGIRGSQDPKILGLTLIKLNANRLMAVLTDMTQIIAQERQIKHSAAWVNAVTTDVADYALMNLDREGRIERWNSSIGRVTGFAAGDVRDQDFSMFYPDGSISPERLVDYLKEADEDGWSLDEGWRIKADGSTFWGSSMIVPVGDVNNAAAISPLEQDRQDYAFILRDITDRHMGAAAYLKAMLSDYLTGLSNRRAFFEAADLELKRWHRQPRPLSIVVIDADFFKKVNDTYGHAAGDHVLQNLALVLKESVRVIDTVARIGGEEFAVMLPSTNIEGALNMAERFRQRVANQRVCMDGTDIRYTVSIGISAMDESVTGFDDLLQRADKALYDAKRAGRNRIEVAGREAPNQSTPPSFYAG